MYDNRNTQDRLTDVYGGWSDYFFSRLGFSFGYD